MNCNMMFRRISLFVLLFVMFTSSIDVNAEEIVNDSSGNILIVYPPDADGETKEAMYELAQMLIWQDCRVTFLTSAESAGRIGDYKNIIFFHVKLLSDDLKQEIWEAENEGHTRFCFVGNELLRQYLNNTFHQYMYEDNKETAGKLKYKFGPQEEEVTLVQMKELLFMRGKYDYSSGILETEDGNGYFCRSIGAVTHFPVMDWDNELVRKAVSQEIRHWYQDNGDKGWQESQYLVLDKIYPFYDQEKLMETISIFADNKVPFVISVMPIYEHADYPGMKHFCEILRYAQANGGTIILHSPINRMERFDADEMRDAIQKSMDNYGQYGVCPLGIQIPSNWTLCEEAKDAVEDFHTVFVSEEKDARINLADRIETDRVYENNHQWVATAVYFDVTEETELIEKQLQECLSSIIPVADLRNAERSIQVNTEFIPFEYEEEYDYHRNISDRISGDLSEENQKLLIAVTAVSVLFIIFLIIARKNNKRKFFYEERDEKL